MQEKNKLFLTCSIILSVAIYLSFFTSYITSSHAQQIVEKQTHDREKAGFAFLVERMQSQEGLIYSWVEDKQHSPEILLESMGQVLEYVSLVGDQALFDYYRTAVETHFVSPQGYYYWQLEQAAEQGKYSSTAFVDELRLAKAYFIIGRGGKEDTKALKQLANKIYKYNVNRNKVPVDFYDGKTKRKASELSLFYVDVETLNKLAVFDKKWLLPFAQAQKILLDMPENELGFYPQKYKIPAAQFLWQENVNMVENLYTALNAQNAGRAVDRFTSFLQAQIGSGQIFNYYNLSGEPASTDDSVSVYALATRLFFLQSDWENARWCYEKVQTMQLAENSALAGGFAHGSADKIYAFNQLEALLMYRYLDSKQPRLN